jgi:hypothetical protein
VPVWVSSIRWSGTRIAFAMPAMVSVVPQTGPFAVGTILGLRLSAVGTQCGTRGVARLCCTILNPLGRAQGRLVRPAEPRLAPLALTRVRLGLEMDTRGEKRQGLDGIPSEVVVGFTGRKQTARRQALSVDCGCQVMFRDEGDSEHLRHFRLNSEAFV